MDNISISDFWIDSKVVERQLKIIDYHYKTRPVDLILILIKKRSGVKFPCVCMGKFDVWQDSIMLDIIAN